MTISEHIISPINGVEYFDIFFRVSNQKDITSEQHREIEDLIYKKLEDYKKETKKTENL